MKRLNLFLMTLIALAAFWACSDDEDNFKAPEIGGGSSSLTESISKDSVNVYHISRNIQSEAGLRGITLTNKTENKELDKVTSFDNVNNYTYNYDVDLTSYQKNTELTFVLSIEDNSGQITSQEIKITVIVPEVKIYLQTEDEEYPTYYDFYYLPFKVKCGLATLKSVVVELNGVKTSLEIKPKIADAFYFDLIVENLNDGENMVIISVEDNNGRSAKSIVKIVKKDAPVGLGDATLMTPLSREYGGFSISSSIENGKIAWFKCDYYDQVIEMMGMMIPMVYSDIYNFYYNDNNTIHKLVYTYNDGTGTETFTAFEYKYKADNAQQLEQIVTYTAANDDGDKAGDATETVYASDFEYELGNITKYKIQGTDYTPKYVAVEGEQVRVDQLNYSSTEPAEYTLTERIANPLYNQFCPAVVTIGAQKLPLDMFFYNKYLYTGLKQGGTVLHEYTIQKNGLGQVEKVIWEGQDTELLYTYE